MLGIANLLSLSGCRNGQQYGSSYFTIANTSGSGSWKIKKQTRQLKTPRDRANSSHWSPGELELNADNLKPGPGAGHIISQLYGREGY